MLDLFDLAHQVGQGAGISGWVDQLFPQPGGKRAGNFAIIRMYLIAPDILLVNDALFVG